VPRFPIAVAVLLVVAMGGAAALVSAGSRSDEGPLAAMTGAPATAGSPAEMDCTLCHQDYNNPCDPVPCNLDAPGGGIEILGVPAVYVPGQAYPLRVRMWCDSTLAYPSPLWGFEMTAFRLPDGAGAGTWEPGVADTFAVIPGSGPFATRTYIEQTFAGARSGLQGEVEWTFQWRAPADDVGEVMFSLAGVAGNGNDEPGAGDFVYTARAVTGSGFTAQRPVSWGSLKARYR
jgi:hypothetical protein